MNFYDQTFFSFWQFFLRSFSNLRTRGEKNELYSFKIFIRKSSNINRIYLFPNCIKTKFSVVFIVIWVECVRNKWRYFCCNFDTKKIVLRNFRRSLRLTCEHRREHWENLFIIRPSWVEMQRRGEKCREKYIKISCVLYNDIGIYWKISPNTRYFSRSILGNIVNNILNSRIIFLFSLTFFANKKSLKFIW